MDLWSDTEECLAKFRRIAKLSWTFILYKQTHSLPCLVSLTISTVSGSYLAVLVTFSIWLWFWSVLQCVIRHCVAFSVLKMWKLLFLLVFLHFSRPVNECFMLTDKFCLNESLMLQIRKYSVKLNQRNVNYSLFMIYSSYFCLTAKSVWWNEAFQCDKQIKTVCVNTLELYSSCTIRKFCNSCDKHYVKLLCLSVQVK